jgi:hypothetical protein
VEAVRVYAPADAKLMESEARAALKTLVSNGDITIHKTTTETFENENAIEVTVDYTNNRKPRPTRRLTTRRITGANR